MKTLIRKIVLWLLKDAEIRKEICNIFADGLKRNPTYRREVESLTSSEFFEKFNKKLATMKPSEVFGRSLGES